MANQWTALPGPSWRSIVPAAHASCTRSARKPDHPTSSPGVRPVLSIKEDVHDETTTDDMAPRDFDHALGGRLRAERTAYGRRRRRYLPPGRRAYLGRHLWRQGIRG